MTVLRVALQATIIYIATAVLVGMSRELQPSVLKMLAVASVFLGLLVMTFVIERLRRGAARSDVKARRHVVALLPTVAAVAALVLAQGVLAGAWHGPARFAGIYSLVVQFAGAWSLALVLALAGVICMALAYRVFKAGAASH